MFPPKREAAKGCGSGSAERVIVAVKVEKVISKAALIWAITHAAGPCGCITLLAVYSSRKKDGRRFWGFPRLKGDCGNAEPNKVPDRVGQISESCSQMVLQVQDQIQARVQIKIVSVTSVGAVAAEAKCYGTNWVILDKKLKGELKCCMDELQCNIVLMKGSQPKILRLNLARSDGIETPFYSTVSSPVRDIQKSRKHTTRHTTPVSSPEDASTSCNKTYNENSFSTPKHGSSVFVVYEKNPLYDETSRRKHTPNGQYVPDNSRERSINVSASLISETCQDHKIFWIAQDNSVKKLTACGNRDNISETVYASATKKIDKMRQFSEDIKLRALEFNQNGDEDYVFNTSIREAVSLGKICPTPPPLCSMCQSKAPAFGTPPKKFRYTELVEATEGFSERNLMTESEFGLVHRGILSNGLIIAVKQLKFSGPQRDDVFCREVHVLSCAQHRNVVLLIGFCIEGNKRLLVYEYICNSSLEFHLHGNKKVNLDWPVRLKIAAGTARGLRYLHEDCRVGCIIHGKLHPGNILLTHDFEPLVAEFGVARLNSDWVTCDRNHVVDTSGYLAPEFFNDEKMTEKVDIYAFGLILLELITGQKACDLQYCIEHLMSDNIHALAATKPIHILAYKHKVLDPYLASHQTRGLSYELHAMECVASLCLQQDPDLRPPMSKVVKMLEGGNLVPSLALDLASVGCRSGHLQGLTSNSQSESNRRHSRRLSY